MSSLHRRLCEVSDAPLDDGTLEKLVFAKKCMNMEIDNERVWEQRTCVN